LPKVSVGGLGMYFELAGEGEPVVFVSGITGDHSGWKPFQVPAFNAAGYRCLVFDNRDVGQTGDSPLASYAIGQFVVDTIGLLDHLQLDRVHLVGYSMGGMIAQELALAHPARLRSLTLMSTAARPDAYVRTMLQTLGAAKRDSSTEDFLKSVAIRVFSYRFHETGALRIWLDRMFANPYPQSVAGYMRQADAIYGHDAAQRVQAIRTPTHVIAGEEDILIPPRFSRALAQSIRGAELTVIPESAHALHAEKPTEFNRAVLDFLKRH
jgi:pimeloyl-ACP methyl ester carboxylesterase